MCNACGNYIVFKPNAQRKTELNSTKLDRSVQFSFPLCIESATSCNVACGSGIVTVNSLKWQHTAMWQVVLGWHATEFAQTSAILKLYICFPFPHITAVDMSFCTSLRNFIQIGPPSAEKMTSCRFSRWGFSAILEFRDPIMGSLKSPIT